MIFFFPVQAEVVYHRWPVMNFVLIGVTSLLYIMVMWLGIAEEFAWRMVLGTGSPLGWIGHLFLHADLGHLLGNMVFLWVFGNALNERVGQLPYLLFYLIAGCTSASLHLLVDGAPAVGASGAINGVVGAYIVLYPLNRVSCAWFVFFRGGTIQISGWVLVLFWFITDVLGALTGGGEVAYWGHIGGFLTGLAFGVLILKNKWVEMETYQNPNLFEVLGWSLPVSHTPEPEPLRAGEVAFECPACGMHNRVEESALEAYVSCWSCKQTFEVGEESGG